MDIEKCFLLQITWISIILRPPNGFKFLFRFYLIKLFKNSTIFSQFLIPIEEDESSTSMKSITACPGHGPENQWLDYLTHNHFNQEWKHYKGRENNFVLLTSTARFFSVPASVLLASILDILWRIKCVVQWCALELASWWQLVIFWTSYFAAWQSSLISTFHSYRDFYQNN